MVAAHTLEESVPLWRSSMLGHVPRPRRLRAQYAPSAPPARRSARSVPPSNPTELARLDLPRADLRDGGFDTSVLFVDAFGNCRLAGQPADLAALRSRLEPGDRFMVRIGSTVHEIPWQPTFGAVEAGAPLLYEDADYAGLAIGINVAPRRSAWALPTHAGSHRARLTDARRLDRRGRRPHFDTAAPGATIPTSR